MPYPKMTEEEHSRRLKIYNKYILSGKPPKEVYALMGKEMFISPKGVEGWIRRRGLKQPEGIKKHLVIGKDIKLWEYKDGTVGKNIKSRSYVKKYPKKDRLNVRKLMAILIKVSNLSDEPLKSGQIGHIMKSLKG